MQGHPVADGSDIAFRLNLPVPAYFRTVLIRVQAHVGHAQCSLRSLKVVRVIASNYANEAVKPSHEAESAIRSLEIKSTGLSFDGMLENANILEDARRATPSRLPSTTAYS